MIDGHRWPDGVREGFSDDHHVKVFAFIPLASTLAWRIGDNSLALDLICNSLLLECMVVSNRDLSLLFYHDSYSVLVFRCQL